MGMRNQIQNFSSRLRLRAAWLAGLCLVQLALAAPASAEALLWRVEGEGGAVSHLFGTMHSDDPRVARLPAPVVDALAGSRLVLLELDLGAPEVALAPLAMILPPGQSLPRLLDEGLYRRALAAMQARGYPTEAVDRMRPWAVAITLAVPPPRSGQFLDLVLYQQATGRGIAVRGLETLSEQLAIFDRLSLDEQRALLRLSLDEYGQEAEAFEAMHRAYLARDLEVLANLSREAFAQLPPGLGARFEDALLTQRNRRMAERAEPALRAGGAFVAVGALHLAGEDGLVARLKARGYRLTPIHY